VRPPRHPLPHLLFACAVLWCAVGARAQGLPERHEALLDRQLVAIQKSRPDVAEVYLLAAGLSSKQDVFRNDVDTIRDLFDRHWGTSGRSLALIADEATRESAAYPTRANLRRAAEGLAKRIDPGKDVLFLFLTSHGQQRGLNATLPGGEEFVFSAADVRRLLEATGARHRVVVISACHSGALLSELADERTVVMTAAHARRASFGCTFTNLHTWFTEALFEALAAEPRFEAAFAAAARRIDEREKGGEAWEHSLPQIHVGEAARAKLAEVERRVKPAKGWQPPVFATEAGQVRRLMGDYLELTLPRSGDPEVRWLQLRTVGAKTDGGYAIDAHGHHFYRSASPFKARYDPKTRELTGVSGALGTLRLKVDDARLSGTRTAKKEGAKGAAASQAAAPALFQRVQRRDIYEASGAHPPARLRASSSSVVRLVYLSSGDCGRCAEWERGHVQEGRLTSMPEFKHIDFVTVKRRPRARLERGDLPGDLAPLYERLARDKGFAPLLSETPAFVLLVDDKVRLWNAGAFLDSPVYPVLRAAVREKTGR
jgi:hypothetical protein